MARKKRNPLAKLFPPAGRENPHPEIQTGIVPGRGKDPALYGRKRRRRIKSSDSYKRFV
jgi:hypothetical protein